MMTYIELHSSGENRIYAFVSEESPEEAKLFYSSRQYDDWRRNILNGDGSDYYKYLAESPADKQLSFAEPIVIDVPQELFAKEPPEWEQQWVYWLQSRGVDNQCDYRKKRIFAYTVQPIALLLKILLELIILTVAFLIGSKSFSFKYLFHPLTYELRDAYELWNSGSWFLGSFDFDDCNSKSDYFFVLVKSLWKIPFMPAVLSVFTLMYYSGILLPVLFSLIAVVLILFFTFLVVNGEATRFLLLIKKLFGRKDHIPWYLNKEEIDLITCYPDKQPITFAQLPRKKKTIKLRYLDLKSKVCKPYSRG